LRAGELTAVWVPDERHEAMRDLSRAREAARKDLKGKRQQVSSFMLRLGRHYPGKKTWGPAHMNWLMLQLAEVLKARQIADLGQHRHCRNEIYPAHRLQGCDELGKGPLGHRVTDRLLQTLDTPRLGTIMVTRRRPRQNS
jgi:transposase